MYISIFPPFIILGIIVFAIYMPIAIIKSLKNKSDKKDKK